MKVETQNIEIKDEGDIVNVTLPPSVNGWSIVVTPTQVRVFQNRSSSPTLICLSTRIDVNAPSPNEVAGPPSLGYPSTHVDLNAPPTDDVAGPPPLSCLFTRADTDALSTNGIAPDDTVERPTEAEDFTATTGTTGPGTEDISTSAAPVDAAIDVTVGMNALALGGHVTATSQPPSHLRNYIVPGEQYRVSKEVLDIYPPIAGIGWKGFSWVVVIRGRDIGVFYDFWARIWPLIKIDRNTVIQGAAWKKAQGETDALRIWASAVENSTAGRI